MMTTTLSTCVKITRRDANVEGYTDHDVDIIVDSILYRSSAGYVPSAVERKSDLTHDNLSIVGIIDNNNIQEDDILSGVYTGARVEIFTVDWFNPSSGPVSNFLVGFFGAPEIDGARYVLELSSLEIELNKNIGRVFDLRCDADLGDSRCGFALVSDSGSITSIVTDKRVFVDSTIVKVDGYYDGGKITWTSGQNIGRSMDVKSQVGGTIELYEPMHYGFSASDAYDITQGCDKTFETCRDTFSRAIDFRGFPHIPGISSIASGQSE